MHSHYHIPCLGQVELGFARTCQAEHSNIENPSFHSVYADYSFEGARLLYGLQEKCDESPR